MEKRPWGTYEILKESAGYKVKIITVDPGHRLSYQYHHKRHEGWTVISGEGIVTLDDVPTQVKQGSYVFIPAETKHRVECTSSEPLVFAEVQLGSYFGEDDIVRLKDDYGRKDE